MSGKSDVLFYTGLSFIGGGLTLASPVDEGAAALATGGLSMPLAPVQGVVTAGAGAAGVAMGSAMVLASLFMDSGTGRRAKKKKKKGK